jgi:hypothetical protein
MSQTQGDAPPAGRLTAAPLPRLAALAVDGATYLIIPALLLPLGLLLIQRGVMLSSLAVNALALANIPRCMGCSRCTWRACRGQHEQPWYSSGASGHG